MEKIFRSELIHIRDIVKMVTKDNLTIDIKSAEEYFEKIKRIENESTVPKTREVCSDISNQIVTILNALQSHKPDESESDETFYEEAEDDRMDLSCHFEELSLSGEKRIMSQPNEGAKKVKFTYSETFNSEPNEVDFLNVANTDIDVREELTDPVVVADTEIVIEAIKVPEPRDVEAENDDENIVDTSPSNDTVPKIGFHYDDTKDICENIENFWKFAPAFDFPTPSGSQPMPNDRFADDFANELKKLKTMKSLFDIPEIIDEPNEPNESCSELSGIPKHRKELLEGNPEIAEEIEEIMTNDELEFSDSSSDESVGNETDEWRKLLELPIKDLFYKNQTHKFSMSMAGVTSRKDRFRRNFN